MDGGAVTNNFLMQFQANILNINVQRPTINESSALGAAFLAGLATGFWKNVKDLKGKDTTTENAIPPKKFIPYMEQTERDLIYEGWKKAVTRAQAWEEHD